MNKAKYPVKLTDQEREKLLKLINAGKTSARIIKRANLLLILDENQENRVTRAQARKLLNTSDVTIVAVTRQYVEEGVDSVLIPKRTDTQHPPIKVDGEVEARLIAIACSTPPEGFSRWSLKRIADKAVELHIVDGICCESVRRALKKRNQTTLK